MSVRASLAVVLMLAFLASSISPVFLHASAGFSPQSGNYFHYYEVESVSNGTGLFAGYSDQTIVNGTEQINSVSGSNVSASYAYSYAFADNQGDASNGTESGNFTFDRLTFLYGSTTDNQLGYVSPTVWFAMNNSLPSGAGYTSLNTQMTVQSKDASFDVPTLKENIQTISAVGTGSYFGSPDNDAYGMLNAKYTWSEYYDPTTGYIVGYNYVEQDSNSSASFTWTDDLYVTSTSYSLTVLGPNTSPISTSASATSTTTGVGSSFVTFLPLIILAVVIIAIIAAIAYAASRRNRSRRLPEHSQPPYRPPPYGQPPPTIDLSAKQPPVQQVVVKDVAKVKCPYCGTLYDSTALNCPRCGAPRV